MHSVEAIFTAVGKSPTVLTLANQLTGELLQRRAIGEGAGSSNTPIGTNSVIVKLPLSTGDDVSVFVEIKRWLELHGSILSSTDAHKVIEFQTFLDLNIGSRTLTVPNTIVRICGNLDLDIANQVIRILTKTEYDAIRGS